MDTQDFIRYGDSVYSVALSLDAKYIVSCDESANLKLWNIQNGNKFRSLTTHAVNYFDALARSLDGNFILMSGFNDFGQFSKPEHIENTLYLWDVKSAKITQTFSGHSDRIRSIAFKPGGKYFLTGSWDHTLKLWDIQNGVIIRTFFGHSDKVSTVAFSPDGRYAVSGSWDHTLKLWDIQNGVIIHTFLGHSDKVNSVAFSPDGKHILSGSDDGTLKFWDLQTEKLIYSMENKYLNDLTRVDSVAFSPDGKLALSGGLWNTLKLWDLKKGSIIRSFNWHYDNINSSVKSADTVVFSPDGLNALSGSSDGSLKLWDVSTGNEIYAFSGHNGGVSQAAFSTDGKQAFSTGWDKTLKIWNVVTAKNIISAVADNNEEHIVWTPDGYFDGSPNSSHLVHMVQGLDVFSIDQFALKYNRPDIILQRLGSPETELIQHYKQLYLRRLAKAGLTEAQLSGELHAPTASITAQTQTDKELELSFELSDSKYPLKAYNIYVNDVPLFGAEGQALSGQDFKAKQKIALNTGENKIEVSVLNNRGAESYRAMTTVNYDKPVKGDLYYLGFGVSEYQDQKLNLKYAHKDALDLEKALKQLPEFKQVHSQVFTNEQVKADQVKKAKAFLAQAKVDDTVVIFISGHGLHDPKHNNQYFFLTHETDLNHLAQTAASFEDLENLLQGIKPRRKLFLMDTCESGEATQYVSDLNQQELQQKGLQIRGFKQHSDSKPKRLPGYLFEKDRFIHNDLFRRSGTVVLSSSQGGEFSYEPLKWREDGNGYFTQAVIEGLKGLADQDMNQTLLKQELFQYVRERVKALTYDKQHPTIDRDNLKQDLQLKLTGISPN